MPGVFKKAPAVPIGLRQRARLEQIVRRPPSTQQHALRARIILLAGEGIGHQAIADQLQVDRKPSTIGVLAGYGTTIDS